MRNARIRAALSVLALVGALAPPALQGQAPDVPQIGEERLRTFAETHLEITAARDDFHGELGRTHDDQGRQRLRMELTQRIAEILTAHEMTQEEFDWMTLVISVDAAQREAFERILEELSGGSDHAPHL